MLAGQERANRGRDMTATTAGPAVDRYAESLHAADAVARQLRATAAERDRANQPPRAEIELLREHDLLPGHGPPRRGGGGAGPPAPPPRRTAPPATGATSAPTLCTTRSPTRRVRSA